ncbi:uncharacterized protein LOC115622024 [Scaptodrosophila lebanonensis]|uniref:Uncharacterized protein LOC115622024 n=1 Tax=Drosophila lebanonensis TaxID=7225 RepID=A0A6J2T9D0_DROLE|nr:uncharacterized protein LOC115622024 [Scaptodrosophila lebanonensis]
MKAKKLAVAFLLFLAISQKCTESIAEQLGLPLIQISHDEDLDNDYPDTKDEIHLEDFFWTGSGDGPPDYLKKVHTGISKGKDVIVKTETVVATVYVDGNNEVDIPICLDCKPDDGGGSWDFAGAGMPPLNYSATDRRYWLLTVMSGFYSAKDNPMLEDKLARLYRMAFTRQQTRHLGINGAQQIAGVAVTAPRERRQPQHATSSTPTITTMESSAPPLPADDVELLDMNADGTHFIKTAIGSGRGKSEWSSSSEESAEVSASSTTVEPSSATITTTPAQATTEPTEYGGYVTLIPWELIQQNGKSEKLEEMREAILSQQALDQQRQEVEPPIRAALPVLRPLHPLFREERVRVVIHNITQISEADVHKWNTSGGYGIDDEYVNLKFNERPIANQTELIYTVLVDGRPVLATTAAKDMELVSEAEAVKAMGQTVYMKSEPYIREPTATALAPVPRSGQAGFFNSVRNNVALVVISSLAILLLLLLLVTVLLLGRTRARQKELSTENRDSSRNELLSENQSVRPSSRGTVLDSTGQTTARSRDVGVQNYAYEREHEARIHFPPAPHDARSRRDSISSTDNTSDSSVYCPINPPSSDVQRILDEKAARLFDGHKRRHHQYDRAEGREDTIYTSVVSEKKSEKSRHKSKRRYLNENRVGSLETSPVQLSNASSADEGNSPHALRRSYENFQRNEAFNPHNNYHRNKILQQQQTLYGDKEIALDSTQAINKEIIKVLQPSEKSSDTASVGSFLSMASVRAFPKSALPEPLNRVLDPVFVTYYDNVDDVAPAAIPHGSSKSLKSHKSHGSRGSGTIATIASFPSPKAPPMKGVRAASHSDNPDPGVVGPIVWERHKKRMNSAGEQAMRYADYSPMHDPSAIRNHYEGLLEGAMQMYASQDDLPMPLPTRDFTNSRRATKREHRGSSAGLPSFPSKAYSTTDRPATAQPEKTPKSAQSTQPPSPTYSAWGGRSTHGSESPPLRPCSADTFNRPETILEFATATTLTTRSNTPGRRRDPKASAAPLIEAIQKMTTNAQWSLHHQSLQQRALDRFCAGRTLEAADLYEELVRELEQTGAGRKQQDSGYEECRERALQLRFNIIATIKTARIQLCQVTAEGQVNRTYADIFGRCMDATTRELMLQEPLLQTNLELEHLLEFLELVLENCTSLSYITLLTHEALENEARKAQAKVFENLTEDLMNRNIQLRVTYLQRQLDPRLLFSNGHLVVSKLGLHYFKDENVKRGEVGSFSYEFRACKANEVQYFMCDPKQAKPL